MPTPRPTTPQDLLDPARLVIVVAERGGTVQAVLVPSQSQPGAYRTVEVSPEGRVTCDCTAGRFGRRCRHRRLAVEARLVAARLLVGRRIIARAQTLGVPPATAQDLYREDVP